MQAEEFGDTDSAVGMWKIIDDTTGRPSALIRISETNGALCGTIRELLCDGPGADQDALCVKCKDERKNQPIREMMIMIGMQLHNGKYTGGRILDPQNGEDYECQMVLVDDGNKLDVRAYTGVVQRGRSQTWLRVPDGD